MPGGRPPLYTSEEELQERIAAYFQTCDEGDKPYTVSGLARHLGMTTETLRTYGKNDQFSATVRNAKQKVEEFLETRLLSNAPTGPIFNLKNNFGWKDKREQDHGISPELQELLQRIRDMDDSELERLEDQL